MAIYTVHERADTSGTITQRADAITFVKEGFAWLALFFPIFWLLYNRMWFVLAGFIGALTAVEIGMGAAGVGEDAAAWAATGLVLMFAFQANDLRRWTLARGGYRLAGPVTGSNLVSCEVQFFDTWLREQDLQTKAHSDRTGRGIIPPPAAKPQQGDQGSNSSDDVIGLFPDTNT